MFCSSSGHRGNVEVSRRVTALDKLSYCVARELYSMIPV